MEITEDDLLKIAFAAYGNSPVRAELSIATWRHVGGWSSLNYCGSDKEIFAICINGDEVEIFTDSHGINHLAAIRKMEELKLIKNPYEQISEKKSDKEVQILRDKFEHKVDSCQSVVTKLRS